MPTRRTPLPPWVIERRNAFGQRVVRLRRAAGLSQDDFGDLIGVERRTIQRWEGGGRDPRYTDLLLMAAALGLSVADLVREETPPAPGSP